MTNGKNTKRALLASALSLALCCAMLLSTTFAWFTDSVTSTGNQIAAGDLKIDLVHVGGGADGRDVSLKKTPQHKIFDYGLWEPGYTVMETLRVVNAGSLALQFRLDAAAVGAAAGPKGEKLADVIDVYVYEGDGIPPTDSFADMTVANGWRNAGPLSGLMADGDGIAHGVLLPEEAEPANGEPVGSVQMTMALHMRETAGNAYQGLSLGDLNFQLHATQYTYEKDGFGSQYDEKAFAAVSSADAFMQAAENSAVIQLTDNIELPEDVYFPKDTVLHMNGKTLTVDGALKAAVGTSLTVQGNGTINGVLYADSKFGKGGTLVIDAGEDFSVYSSSDNGWAVYGGAGSSIVINGGTYSTSEKKGTSGTIHTIGASLAVNGAVVDVGPGSVMNAYGIYSNARENTLTNVTVNGKYSKAVYLNNAYGKTVIRGGTFITNKAVDDSTPEDPMPVNPTIYYQGALDISDAAITRIGTGILYDKTWPKPTEVENLTIDNCTFTVVGENNSFKDIDFDKN
ncbi:MAG TPA: SipW-dependent-type signal peptide-containing protein [Firmicutes bacterium]|nr:SipW-dependent-type signal peptide-containing protein [Bacillota bacterium]